MICSDKIKQSNLVSVAVVAATDPDWMASYLPTYLPSHLCTLCPWTYCT